MSDGLVSFKVEGLSALQAQLVDLGAQLGQKTLARAARQAFKPVLEMAMQLVPTDSGALRDALRISVKKTSEGDSVVVVGIRIGGGKGNGKELPPARRWHFIELGTAHQAAHPFLRPAIDANAGAVVDLLAAELKKAIARSVARKAAGKE